MHVCFIQFTYDLYTYTYIYIHIVYSTMDNDIKNVVNPHHESQKLEKPRASSRFAIYEDDDD